MSQITQTKLYCPSLSVQVIPSPRLSQHLDACLGVPLTLISAPAGSGKSTLVCDWLQHMSLPAAWLSLDEKDNSSILFLSYMMASLQVIFPDVGSRVSALLHAPTLPPDSVLQQALLNDLNEINQDYVLVLEDFHLIHNITIHDLLTAVLRHPPRTLHLILISRMDPPLPMAQLRAKGQMIELREADLRFSNAETDRFLQQALDFSVSPTLVDRLTTQTGGWAAGLWLITHALRGKPDPEAVLRSLEGGTRQVYEYFALEVLANISTNTYDFLLQTALLDKLCPALCNHLLGLPENDPHSGEILDRLWQMNLFITPLDPTHEWYRYHPLFRQFLRQLQKERHSHAQIVALHLAACAWYEQRGLLDDALSHAQAVEDESVVAAFIIRHRHPLFNEEAWQRLATWLMLLSEDTVQQSPELLLTKAMLANDYGRWQALQTYVEQVEAQLNQMPPDTRTHALWGEVYMLRSVMLSWEGKAADMIAVGEQALARLPERWQFLRTATQMLVGAGKHMAGQKNEAFNYLYRVLEEKQERGLPQQTALIFLLISISHLQDNDLHRSQETAQAMLNLSNEHRLPGNAALAHYLIGCSAYHTNDLDTAITHLEQAAAVPYLLRTYYYVQVVCALAHAYQSVGRMTHAFEVIDTALQIVLNMQSRSMIAILEACRVKLALRRGERPKLMNWTVQVSDAEMRFGFYEPTQTHIELLLIENTPSSLEDAAEMLTRYLDLLRHTHNVCHKINTLLMQAWLHKQRGDTPAALETLKQSVQLAAPGSGTRVFIDMILVLGDLYCTLQDDGVAVAFLDAVHSGAADAAVLPALHNTPNPLSDRELEILKLLGAQLTNDEISRQLFISHGTVKQHTHRIYRKLGVKNRDQAVKLARSIQLL